MGKPDFMSPKAIANRIKSKGLQKLRWYCQMCNKQCRDENGFKCHTMTEGHIRMMSLFSESADKFMTDFSGKFERHFIGLLSRRYGQRRVLANSVYNEYIQDKEHVHMNSTIWPSLTEFVKYLGRAGKCVVDETERGWFVQYIDRDPEVLKRQEAADRARAADIDDEMRHDAEIDAMVAVANALQEAKPEVAVAAPAFSELRRDPADKVKFALHASKAKVPTGARTGFEEDTSESANSAAGAGHAVPVGSKRSRAEYEIHVSKTPLSSVASLVEEETARKRWLASREVAPSVSAVVSDRVDHWLVPGIIVKILNSKVGAGKFFKQKGTVIDVVDKFVGVLQVDSGEILKIDQSELETVIPALGNEVFIVNGPHRGKTGKLEQLYVEEYSAVIALRDGTRMKIPYEEFCKLSVGMLK